MTRCRMLLLSLALLPMAATLSLLALSSAEAQSQDYIPPQQGDAPRSLRPPQAGDTYYPPQGGSYSPQGGSDNPGYGQPYSAPPPNSSAYAPPPANVPPPSGGRLLFG